MDIKSYIEEKGKKAREGARRLATLSTAVKNNALIAMAEAIELDADRLKRENRKDIEAGKARSLSSAMIDRLTLNDKRIKEMAQGLKELVGRVMIDPEFLAELQRSPAALLAQYQLTDDERAKIQQALDRLAKTPVDVHRHEFHNALIRRVAT